MRCHICNIDHSEVLTELTNIQSNCMFFFFFLLKIIPATSFRTWDADGAVQLLLPDEESLSYKPKSVYTMLTEVAEDYPNQPALAVKRGGVWKYVKFLTYFLVLLLKTVLFSNNI